MRQGELNSTKLKVTHPICPACDVPMWLTHFESEPTKPGHAKCTFECKACGGSVTEVFRRPKGGHQEYFSIRSANSRHCLASLSHASA
jgi:hypothetical protein